MLIAILVVLILAAIWGLSYAWQQSRAYARVQLGKYQWRVLENLPNSKFAAALLESTHDRVIDYLEFLQKKYLSAPSANASSGATEQKDVSFLYRAEIVKHILKNYDPEQIYETDPRSGDTSYTLNKGDVTYLCLRSRRDPSIFVEPDILFFVVLHEIAHIGNFNDWGHSKQFWEVFKFLLSEAVRGGFYTAVDYKKNPQRYCGITIDYQPLFDNDLRDL